LIAESSDQKLKTDSIFAGESLLEISIQLPPQDWRILRTQYSNLSVRPDENGFKPSSYTYFKGDITIDGLKVQAVGIRKKGSMGSVISTRPSLKIKLVLRYFQWVECVGIRSFPATKYSMVII